MTDENPVEPEKPSPRPTLVHPHETTVQSSETVDPWDLPPPIGEDDLSVFQQFRHSGWRPLRKRMIFAMIEAGISDKTIQRFQDCGRSVGLYHSPSTGKHSLQGNFCKCRTCIPCATARSRLISSNLIEFLGDRETRFLTLTIKHRGESLKQSIRRLKTSFKLLRNEEQWKSHVIGFAAFLEAKWSERSSAWHVHYHILFEGHFWPQKELSNVWHECTGDSYIVDIQAKGTNATRAYYAAKYASKPFDAGSLPDDARLGEAVRQLHRVRLWIIGGSWKGLQLLKKPDSEITDWTFICGCNKLFDDARSGQPQAQEIVRTLTMQHEHRIRTFLPPDDSP